jgi:hypothetical protein
MIATENLSEAEKALLLDLLESEQSELPVEIRHTRNALVRDELHQRAKLVHELLERMRMPIEV